MNLPTPKSLLMKNSDIPRVWQEFERFISDVSPIYDFDLDFSLDSAPEISLMYKGHLCLHDLELSI